MLDTGKITVLYRQVINLEESLSRLPDELMQTFHGQTVGAYAALRKNIIDLLCKDEGLCALVGIAPESTEDEDEATMAGPALLSGLAILKGALETIVLSHGSEAEQQIVGFRPPSGTDLRQR